MTKKQTFQCWWSGDDRSEAQNVESVSPEGAAEIFAQTNNEEPVDGLDMEVCVALPDSREGFSVRVRLKISYEYTARRAEKQTFEDEDCEDEDCDD